MKVKEDVILQGLKIEIRPVLGYSEDIWKAQGIKEGVTITSALDGVHSAWSYHPFGYAVDLRTRYFTKEQVITVSQLLQTKLDMIDSYYDVVVEGDHIHVEYDFYKSSQRMQV